MNYTALSSVVSPLLEVGGKGLHLQKLMGWGANVPTFFVLTTECYRHYRSTGDLPAELSAQFEAFFKTHPTIALRSSMIAEDQMDSSFAGLFETILDVTSQTWKEALVAIYKSVNAPRVLEYLERKKLKVDMVMAVVAQAQVNVQKSGVLFTRSPVEPTSVIAIDAAFGMGEGVVSGHSLIDHYQFTRGGELILQVNANSESVLTEAERKELLETSIKLEGNIGHPSDIEWGIKDGVLHIFQIRPITREFSPLTYLVDTNLSESYPGTVSPFTAKFVQRAYYTVFRESAVIMGATQKRIGILEKHYEKLISHVDDHLYYNLEHYYAVLRALPAGEKNIDNWHKMVGGEPSGVEIPRHSTEISTVESIGSLASLVKLGFSHKKVFAEFLASLDKTKTEILKDQEKLGDSKATINYLCELLERPLGFGLTAVNDIYIMMGLGYLTKAFKKKGLAEGNVIDLLKTSDGVDSLKPLELFNSLVEGFSEEFILEFEKRALGPGFDPYPETLKELRALGFAAPVAAVVDFLAQYGDRSFEELKLESLPLRNNPRLFVHLLKWAKNNPSIGHKSQANPLQVELTFFEQKCINFTRECIAMREATRLWRGKFYHLIRMLVLRLGHQLTQEDSRWSEFSVMDFFSLNHSEWLSYRKGELGFEDVKKLIVLRRPWQTKRQQYPEMIFWVESEKLPVIGASGSVSDISGQGVSPGVTEGVALVLENPNEALESELKDFILVTKNTDPAWVYIMSRSQGLISEKGSLLSHTAIIGRELCIPTIVGVKGATSKIKTGDRLRMDATSGRIEVL
ncbi:MAG TPA: PEP/pyruvate-binding domain-containing protein [Bacteriovoracaceae bacterium]|nr:PEP/pyruvate-binding domain-containing protein [Bacteriovoracaceae bacterium]